MWTDHGCLHTGAVGTRVTVDGKPLTLLEKCRLQPTAAFGSYRDGEAPTIKQLHVSLCHRDVGESVWELTR